VGKGIVSFHLPALNLLQNYLKEFANLFEEFKEKDVAIFAVCAEPQDQADRMEQELSLPYKACL